MIIYPIIAAVGIMLASLAGIFFLQKTTHDFLDKNLQYLLSFAGGVFLIVSIGLLSEGIELLGSFWAVAGFAVVGFLFAEFLTKLLPESHHHHESACVHKHSRYRIIAGDILHNITDGFVLVAAFAVSPIVGIGAFVSIFVHEFIQEVSEFFILRSTGLSVSASLIINFIVSSTILIGVLIGFLVIENELIQGVLMTVSAGIFIHVLAVDLLPHRRTDHKSHLGKHAGLLILGILLTAGLTFGIGHGHSHGGDHAHAEHSSDDHE